MRQLGAESHQTLVERARTVEAATGEWWMLFVATYPELGTAPHPAVEWLSRGSTAGRADLLRWVVAFNRPMLRRPDGFRTILPDTVVHELAHLAAFRLYGSRGHDAAWQSVMQRMGFAPTRTHTLDVTGLPGVQRRWRYQCGCGEVMLSTTRHRRIEQGQRTYQCTRCRQRLVRAPQERTG